MIFLTGVGSCVKSKPVTLLCCLVVCDWCEWIYPVTLCVIPSKVLLFPGSENVLSACKPMLMVVWQRNCHSHPVKLMFCIATKGRQFKSPLVLASHKCMYRNSHTHADINQFITATRFGSMSHHQALYKHWYRESYITALGRRCRLVN